MVLCGTTAVQCFLECTHVGGSGGMPVLVLLCCPAACRVLLADIQAYNSYCGPTTARLFLESMYQEFVSTDKSVLHMQLLNHEHLWSSDAHIHQKMQVFLW